VYLDNHRVVRVVEKPRYAFVMDNDYVVVGFEELKDLVEYAMRNPRAVAVQGVNLKPDGKVFDASALITTFLKLVFGCDSSPWMSVRRSSRM